MESQLSLESRELLRKAKKEDGLGEYEGVKATKKFLSSLVSMPKQQPSKPEKQLEKKVTRTRPKSSTDINE